MYINCRPARSDVRPGDGVIQQLDSAVTASGSTDDDDDAQMDEGMKPTVDNSSQPGVATDDTADHGDGEVDEVTDEQRDEVGICDKLQPSDCTGRTILVVNTGPRPNAWLAAAIVRSRACARTICIVYAWPPLTSV